MLLSFAADVKDQREILMEGLLANTQAAFGHPAIYDHGIPWVHKLNQEIWSGPFA
jgi:hypothetical protein